LSADVRDFSGTDIDILVTHRYGEVNAAVQLLILEAMREGCLKAQELGLLREGIDISSMGLDELAKALRVKYGTHSLRERGSEAVVVAKIINAGIGAANIKLFHEFFMPGSTPLVKLGFRTQVGKDDKPIVRGFRAIVRRTKDVLAGNYDGDVYEYEVSSACNVKGVAYPSVNQSQELLARISQPNDFLITAIYSVEGSALPSTEPMVSVMYQPVYGEEGNLRTLNPTFLYRSQSGADAVGGVASMFYEPNFVPGGPNGGYAVITRPATLNEARKAPPEGIAHTVVYGWQSERYGVIPAEPGERIDHVAINPVVFYPERKLADFLKSVMITHQNDQPYIAPFAAEERVAELRREQSPLWMRAPQETDIDELMVELEEMVASGRLLAIDDDKADMGGMWGHNFAPPYMLAINRATIRYAVEKGILTDGDIIGFVNNMRRLKRGITYCIGDDAHLVMVGDKSRNNILAHQLSFLSFTRGYLAYMIGNTPEFDPATFNTKVAKEFSKGIYAGGQDFQGKLAKLAMKNPYFYSQFDERFFAILRETMPQDYMQMVDNIEKGWRHWQETKTETVELARPFTGNVSNQGIGSARYLVDIAGGERTFGTLSGDKMGPAALNRIIREGVYDALKAGEFTNGLVFEIWDAKAFDEEGNIPINELPLLFRDVEESIVALGSEEQAIVQSYYRDGELRDDLTVADKKKLGRLLKNSGYVPHKRIFLDAQQDRDAIYRYLADSDRFNVKQVWSKKKPGWWTELESGFDVVNLRDYLDKPVLGSSVTKLGVLAGGEYVGKDDPVMIGSMKIMSYIYEFLRVNPLLCQGDMNGSHWLAAIPTSFRYAVANKESHPILVGMVYTLSEDGTKLTNVEDVFGKKDYVKIRHKLLNFNFEFKRAQLGGQMWPYGTDVSTVEAMYPLAKLLRDLDDPNSPFLVSNMPKEKRATRPTGIIPETMQLFDVAALLQAIKTSPLLVVGVPKEIKSGERRVGLSDKGVRALTNLGVKVIVESGAGIGSGISDDDYRSAGAEVVETAAEVWNRAGLIKKVKEPLPQEYEFIRSDHTIFTYFHLASPENKELTEVLMQKGATCAPYETIKVDNRTPLLEPMSKVAGTFAGWLGGIYTHLTSVRQDSIEVLNPERIQELLSQIEQFNELEDFYTVPEDIKLEGVKVVVLGGGVAGQHAAEMYARMGAEVAVTEKRPSRRAELEGYFKEKGLKVMVVDSEAQEAVEQKLKESSIIVGAIYELGARAPQVIDKEMLGRISQRNKKIIIDISIDQGGNIFGSKPTKHEEPVYLDEAGNTRYCVPNMPAAAPRVATKILEKANIFYALALTLGLDRARQCLPQIANGAIVKGKLTDPKVANAHGLAYSPLEGAATLRRGEGTPKRCLREIRTRFRGTTFTIPGLLDGSPASESTLRREVAGLEEAGLVERVTEASGNKPAEYKLADSVSGKLPDEQFDVIESIVMLDQPSLTDAQTKVLKTEIATMLGALTTDTYDKVSGTRVIVLSVDTIGEELGFGTYLRNLLANTQGRVKVIIDGSRITDTAGFLKLTGLEMEEGTNYKIVTAVETLIQEAKSQAKDQDSNIVVVGTEGYLQQYWQSYEQMLKLQVNTTEEGAANLGILPAAVSIALGQPLSELLERVGQTNTYVLSPTAVTRTYSEQLKGYKAQLRAK
ncbi:MAG: fructose 1,6-bisphosphatase, partial [Candidatus Omnitrophica bacterium]|nr:fructose 1,6-bisphosphatase [Candidatus Omnitrophota bacterium]